jgi:hypothetical protein
MEEIVITEKQKHLNKHFPFKEITRLTEKDVAFSATRFLLSKITKHLKAMRDTSLSAAQMFQSANGLLLIGSH